MSDMRVYLAKRALARSPEHRDNPHSQRFADLASLRRQHLDYHAIGILQGSIPAEFLHHHRLIYCGF